LDLRFKSYEVFKISALLRAGSQPLSMQQILPKTAKSQNFEIPPKIEILVFFRKKISMYRGGTRACFHYLDFNPRIFHTLFLLSKNGLVCEFQHTPLWKLMIFSRFHTLCGHEILWTYLTHLEIRI
jgi:hypothetical protein